MKIRNALLYVLLTLSPFICVLTAEFAARSYYFMRYGKLGKQYGLLVPDPDLGTIHRAHSYNSTGFTNDYGFRNEEDVKNPKPPGSLRVVAYGGSTTFCYNLHFDHAWPLLLEARMRKQRTGGAEDQVLNAGAVMWSIGHVYTRAKREIGELKPDLVLLYSGINELNNEGYLRASGINLEDEVKRGNYGVIAKNYYPNWLSNNSLVYKFLMTALEKLKSTPPENGDPTNPIWKRRYPYLETNYLAVLDRFVDLVEKSGSKLVFIKQMGRPDTAHLTRFSELGYEHLSNRNNVLLIDPSEIVRKHAGHYDDIFTTSGVHLTEQGSGELANFLYSQLFENQRAVAETPNP